MENNYNTKIEENVQTESCYCSIANGGLSVSINKSTFSNNDEVINVTPILVIEGSNYGVKLTGVELPTTPQSLRNLGNWFLEQADSADQWTIRSSSSHDFTFITKNVPPINTNNLSEDSDDATGGTWEFDDASIE